ncbi:hypothetical protein B0T16DRAFT_385633 [Cercophora newfieldiana]|uniref:AA1-like domain-containing protein n=1 Tax=Cercophora newfieldiana TaxID=92897 RepID=A0AA40CZB9_9PEZI|nr:hypothetical protein B0T16DRAFT_385633 [Cercophora newfieldiana]
MAQYLFLLLFGTLAASVPTPTTSEPESCASASMSHATWEVKGFNYRSSVIYTFPSHRIANGYVDFNLTNLALPSTMTCSASSVQVMDFFYGNQWFKCLDPAGNDAEFQFDKASGRVDIQQKWECTDSNPVSFMATGSTNVKLECQTKRWQNPNWTSGAFYSTEYTDCIPQDFTLKPAELMATT